MNLLRQDKDRVVALDERRLLPRHCQGDPTAFAELLNRYRAKVAGYLVRCGVPEAARDDLFQEIFCRIHAAAKSYQPDRPLAPWLFAVVANTVRSHYRKERVRVLVNPDAAVANSRSTPPSAQELAEARETAAWVEQEMAQLPFAQREVVALSCIRGLTHEVVAEVLNMPLPTVRTHLFRARGALAKALARRKAQLAREVSV